MAAVLLSGAAQAQTEPAPQAPQAPPSTSPSGAATAAGGGTTAAESATDPAAASPADATAPGAKPQHGFLWALGQTTPAGVTDPSTPYGNWWKRMWAGQRALRNDGGFDVFLSGYAWHPPTSYEEEKKDDLNEKAWGTGIGRTLVDSGGQHRSVYLFVSEDSHNDPQVMLGYSWLARTPSAAGLRLGAGYTLMMISRDEFGYIPVPFATPLFSLDVGPVQAILSYVPKYDVWYVFGRIAVKGPRNGRVVATR